MRKEFIVEVFRFTVGKSDFIVVVGEKLFTTLGSMSIHAGILRLAAGKNLCAAAWR